MLVGENIYLIYFRMDEIMNQTDNFVDELAELIIDESDVTVINENGDYDCIDNIPNCSDLFSRAQNSRLI